MYLKSLTLRGFKSFASATTLAFEPGITAIVGPNGSGKSNVVDALAWVMGEQGAKSLRGGKMDDVIFAGTTGRAPLGRAEVSLTIDNTDGMLPIDYTEVTISRTLFRAGGSEYAINGQACRLLDVQELLSDTGMGREMHVIVGQGQLDQILQATPEMRRGFVEEAAGVLKHRRRKDKALRKLDATQANLARLTDLIAELRRQLKPLGRQAEVARRAATVQAELRDAKARLLADDLTQARLALESDRAAGDALRERRQSAERELAAASDAEAAAERTLAESAPRLNAAQENWYALAGLAERITATRSVAAERMRRGEDQPAVPAGRDPQDLEREIDQARAEEAALAEEVRIAQASLDEAIALRTAAEVAEAESERHYAACLRAVADRREGLARLTGKVGSLESRLGASGEEEQRLEARRAEAIERAEAAEDEFRLLETRLTGMSDGESGLDADYERAEEQLAAIDAEIDGLRETERAGEQRVASLMARLDALQVGLQRRDASGQILADPGFGGLLGPVSDLVSVQPGWQAAVSAALGAATDALAVRDLGSALEIVGRLTDEDLGRAGLVIAGTPVADPAPGESRPPLPPGAQWAVEVIGADPSVRPALHRLLRQVAVVDDLAAAERLVTQVPNAVAVTAAGDVVSAWFVAGGSGAKPSVIEVQATIQETETSLEAARHEMDRVKFALARAGATRQTTEQASARALERLHESDAELSALAERLGSLRQAGTAARAEAERLAQALSAAEQGRRTDHEALADLRDRLGAAQRDADLTEPDPAERDRNAELARQARGAETEARLALRTAQERARLLAGRAESLIRAAQRDRDARAKAQARYDRLRREARVAAAVHAGAGWLSDQVVRAQAAAAGERTAAQETRQAAQAALAAARAAVRDRSQVLETIAEGEHRDQMARIELTMRLEQITEKAMTELGLDADTLAGEYGPDRLVPVLVRKDGTPVGPDDDLPEAEPYVRERQAARLRTAQRNLEALGRVNPLALEEFDAMSERHAFLAEQLDDLKKTRADLLGIVEEVDNRVQEVFSAAYDDVAATFADVFARLFPGGEGRLVLTAPDDMLATGIDVEARPAGKKVRRLSLLSGGERSLVAVAFLISLFIARPSPFYILDEVEAALDDVNLGRLLGIYQELRRSSQLLIITHQKRTMETADALYGVTMRGDGVSTVISQRLHDR